MRNGKRLLTLIPDPNSIKFRSLRMKISDISTGLRTHFHWSNIHQGASEEATVNSLTLHVPMRPYYHWPWPEARSPTRRSIEKSYGTFSEE